MRGHHAMGLEHLDAAKIFHHRRNHTVGEGALLSAEAFDQPIAPSQQRNRQKYHHTLCQGQPPVDEEGADEDHGT